MEPVRPQSDRTIAKHAIEVVSLFGESVQDVTHLSPPQPGLRRRAFGLIGIGAALVIVAAVLFAMGVSTASRNDAAFASHLETGGAAHEFRPERMSRAADGLALVGSMGGLLLIGFGLARLQMSRRPSRVRAGQGPDCKFALALPVPDFDAVSVDDSGTATVRAGGDLQLSMALGETLATGEELVDLGLARMDGDAVVAEVPEDGTVRLERGDVRLLVSKKAAPASQMSFTGRLDRRVALFLAGSAAAHLLLLALLKTVPATGAVLGDIDDNQEGRLSSLRADAMEQMRLEEPEPSTEDPSARGTEAEDVATGSKGTMGSEDSTARNRAAAVMNRGVDPTLARGEAARRARTAGILGVMNARQDLFASLDATADFSSGIDSADYAGGMYGDLGDAQGEWSGAWGNRQHFVGSPYYREGTVKVGRLPTGTPGGYDMSGVIGGDGLRNRKPGAPIAKDPSIGPVGTSGGLDKTIIRRHIRRKLAQIRHCYERRLMVAPDLAGTVVSKFTISPLGKVQGATASGANDGPLEECVASVVATIEFPKTDDGGAVLVTYPFTFQSIGG